MPVHHSEVVCCVSPSPQYDTFIWYHRNVTWGFIVSECCLAGHLGKALPACVLPRQLVVSLILVSPLLSSDVQYLFKWANAAASLLQDAAAALLTLD